MQLIFNVLVSLWLPATSAFVYYADFFKKTSALADTCQSPNHQIMYHDVFCSSYIWRESTCASWLWAQEELSRKDVTISACQVQRKYTPDSGGTCKEQKLYSISHRLCPLQDDDAYYAPPSTAVIQLICIHPTQCRFPVYIRPRNHHKLIPFSLPTGCLHLTNYSGGWIHNYPSQGVMDASTE